MAHAAAVSACFFVLLSGAKTRAKAMDRAGARQLESFSEFSLFS